MKAILIVILMVFFAGCATATPKELINARTAYTHASKGPAAELVPADLHKARTALDDAEQSFKANSDSYKTLDLAYVAQRKSELAGALGAIAADKIRKAQSDADYEARQTKNAKQARQDLVDSENRMADEKVRRDLSDSENRTAAALAALAKLAAVKEEERGLVITLSGSILFESSKSVLLTSAQLKLDQVVRALLNVRERNLIVEGYTDSQGSDSYNQSLSQNRANTVRKYLIRGGYPSDRVRAKGMGESNPIADNASPEGRANNRRVEIVIERDSHASSNY